MTTNWQCPPGMVCVTTYGSVQSETAFALMEARSFAEKQGLVNLQWAQIHGALVDKARNEAMRRLLAVGPEWLIFVDGDMVFEPDAIFKLLERAYGTHPHFDVLGGYCNLRGGPALPTIDTGTGTWESWYPGQGVIDVMRTGAAFVLIKKHVAQRIPDPWFALRVPMRILDAIQEVDTFCRTVFDGRNPMRGLPSRAWETMTDLARQHSSSREQPFVPAEVGEDSSFCDRVTAAGMRIGVDTDLIIRHIVRQTQDWTAHRDAMEKHDREHRLLSGFAA